MCAITRLLDDAATCFLNWSSVMSATGTLYFALCSSRLQMYGKQRADGRGRGDALLLLGLGSLFRFYTDAALIVLLFLSGHVPAATSGVKRARSRPRLVKCVCFKKGLLRRRVAPEAASPSRSDAASLSIVAGHRREPPCR